MASPAEQSRYIEYTYRGEKKTRIMASDHMPERGVMPDKRAAYLQEVLLSMRGLATGRMSSGKFRSHFGENLQDGGSIALADRFRLESGSTPEYSYSYGDDITSQAMYPCNQPFVFALTHRTHPHFNARLYPLLIAGLSFQIEGFSLQPRFAHEKEQRSLQGLSRGDIVVEQIQAAPSINGDNGKLLAGIYWQKFLLETTVVFGRKEGFPRVVVRPAEQNVHLHNPILVRRGQKHFNQTAIDCGFVADGDVTSDGKFVLDLT